MKKIKCPCCGRDVYQIGNGLMADLGVFYVVVDDNSDVEFIDSEGNVVKGYETATPESTGKTVDAYKVHPCTYWEQNKDKLGDIAWNKGWWPDSKNPGMFFSEIYVDYRDELSEETAIEILESQNPMNCLEDKIFEWYAEAAGFMEDDLIQAILDEIPELEAVEDRVRDWVYDHCSVEYPIKHFLDQDVYINIEVDTGDANYDFVLNNVYPAYDGSAVERINDRASILWLAKQQGYTKTQLRKALVDKDYGDSKFLKSIREEILNVSSHMNTLTFLWETTLEEAIALAKLIRYKESVEVEYEPYKSPYCGYIVLDKDTRCGLYDSWNGGGSIFEISLEKDVRLPAKYIYLALPDGGHGYSIGSCYGVNGRFWEGGDIKEIHFPNKYKKEIS